MKAQILKIAGVKNEKEFYKKFPTEEAFMKKHGKELKKAAGGASVDGADFFGNTSSNYGYNANTSNSFVDAVGKAKGGGDGDSDGFSSVIDKLVPLAGTLVGNVQDYNQTNRDIKKMSAYANIADVVKQASSLQNAPQPRKIDYNSMRSETVNPLGVGTNYLAARYGAEIQNTFAPNTIYTDMGYEPLNDSNVKQFDIGGKLDAFSGVAGGLGGMLGSKIGGGTGKGGPGSRIGSALGGIGGSFLGPGGTFIGETAGGIIGGLFDAPQQKEMQEAEDRFASNINKATMQSGAQSFQAQNSSFMEDGGWVSNDWMPQTITKFGDYSMDQLLAPPHDADMLRSGGHLAQVDYTAPSARAMYTGRAEYGSQMAFGGDVQVDNGYMRPLSNDVQELVGPSHENGGMPFSNGDHIIEAEGKETVMKTYGDGGPMDDGSVTIFGNRIINKDAADFVGIKPGRKYKIESKDLALKQDKFEKKATKNFESANDMRVDDMFSQIEQRTKLLNGEAFTKKAAEIKEQLQDLAIYQNETGDVAEALKLEINAFDKGIAKPVKESNMAKFGAKLESFDKGGESKYKGDPNHFWIKRLLEFEKKKGASGGNPHDSWGWNNPRGFQYDPKSKLYKDAQGNLYNGDGKWTRPKTIEEAEEMFRKEYLPDFLNYPVGVRQRMADLAFNSGEDARIYELDQYLRKYKNMPEGLPNRPTYRKGKPNAANFENVYDQYKKEIEALPIQEQVSLLDKGRDFFYKNLNMQNGKPSSDYDDTWKYRISEIDFDTPEAVTTPETKSASSVPASAPASTQYTAIPTPVKSSAPATKELWQIPKKERAALAIANGIKNYKGTKAQNMKLLDIINKPTPMTEPGQGVLANAPVEPFNMFKGINPTGSVAPTAAAATTAATPSQSIASSVSSAINNPADIASAIGINSMPERPSYSTGDFNSDVETKSKGKKDRDWVETGLSTLRSLAPFINNPADEPLNPDQLLPGMMALGMNQLEPVQAQLYNPMLQAQPYRVSLQDQRNEVIAQQRAAERMAYGNPSAAAMIAAGSSDALNKINAEEFRANQAETMRAAEANRAMMNDAQLKNLGILDQQFTRQAAAKSNTKAQALEVAKNFAQMSAENRKANRRNAILRNMYPAYSYTKSGIAYKDPMYTSIFNVPDVGTGAESKEQITSPANIFKNEETTKSKKSGRNGAIVKAIKGL